jgi:hypothetical protein
MSLAFILIAYAVIGWLFVAISLAQKDIHVNWFFITVPGHLYQDCRSAYPKVDRRLQWIALSCDVAVFLFFSIFLLSNFEII